MALEQAIVRAAAEEERTKASIAVLDAQLMASDIDGTQRAAIAARKREEEIRADERRVFGQELMDEKIRQQQAINDQDRAMMAKYQQDSLDSSRSQLNQVLKDQMAQLDEYRQSLESRSEQSIRDQLTNGSNLMAMVNDQRDVINKNYNPNFNNVRHVAAQATFERINNFTNYLN